jgi:hypothetical protein
MKYSVPRKMKPMKLVEMQKEWWNMYEVGPHGFYRNDKPAGAVIMDWHRYAMIGARLFGLTHEGQVHAFFAVAFRKKEPAAHIHLAYVPVRSRGKGYSRELKRQFFELAQKEGIAQITVDCMTPEGEALFKDGVVIGTNKHGRPKKEYRLDKE